MEDPLLDEPVIIKDMKNLKILFTFALLLLFGLGNAQKIGVVDTEYILGMMPQYKEAEARLNAQIDTCLLYTSPSPRD